MAQIRCVVERITFQNPENGYSVLKCAVKGYQDLVTLVGNMPDVNVGSVLLVSGDWKTDRKYGQQFQAETWEETLPATVFGLEKYLGSGLVKGVGPKFARRIVQRFGMETMDILEREPERLLEVDGIGQKRVEQIRVSWEKQKEIKNVMIFLQSHGVSTAYAARIYATYGNDAIKIVQENPYRLADDIRGIGFRTADQIASKLGFEKNCYTRCRGGILYTLSTLADEGHVCADRQMLLKTGEKLLEVDVPTLVMTLDEMIRAGDVHLEKDLVRPRQQTALNESSWLSAHSDFDLPEESKETGPASEQTSAEPVYLQPFYYAEIGVANRLKKLLKTPAEPIAVDIRKIEKQTGMAYDEIQEAAILQACGSKVMVLTGGPGTGKTTTTLGILRAFAVAGKKLILAAPTGRAAKRLAEATGMEAKTIHRLLEFKPPEGFQKNEQNPLSGDVLILDECSMIDLILMNSLLKAVPAHMRVILVGDVDQLPSVGAGNVLRDIIDSGIFPVVRLTRIFRQAMSSRIVMNAHAINEGRYPELRNGTGTDFFWINDEDPDHVAEQIVSLVRDRLPKYSGTRDIQVLTPMQRGAVGAAVLNQKLQQALNPGTDGLHRSGMLFRNGDKVMQIRNDYDKEVFNGDIGTICSVNLQDQELTVNFDGQIVPYDVTELDELTLAYATTIHKSQGSEYPVVVMPVLMTHYVMLQRNLIYTGITRAKKLIVLIGTRKALNYAIHNVTVTNRGSMLKERLISGSDPLPTYISDNGL